MHGIRHNSIARLIASVLVVATIFGPGTAWAARKPAPKTVTTKSVLVFPMDDSTAKAPAGMGKDMAETMRGVISSTSGYISLVFSDRLPSVRRAVEEGAIRKNEIAGPFAGDKSPAPRMASEVGAESYINGSIEDISVNATTKQAEVTLSAQLVDTKTGDVLKTVVLSGKSPDGKKDATDAELVSLAAGAAVAKAAGELLPDVAASAVVTAANAERPTAATTKPAASKPVEKPVTTKAPQTKKIVMIFPVKMAAASAPADLSTQIAQWMKSTLGLAPGYMSVEFNEKLRTIERMINEGTLKKSDYENGFSDNVPLANRVAKDIGADEHVICTVDDYSFDAKAKTAQVKLTAQLVDATTGKVISKATVTGKTPAGVETSSERELSTLAAADAVANASQQLAPGAPGVVAGDFGASKLPKKKRISGWKMFLFGAAIAGGIALVSGGSSGSSSGGTGGGDNPPPPDY